MNAQRQRAGHGEMGSDVEDLDPVGEFKTRSDLTRYQLLMATMKLIGKQGYKATTTREIAMTAEVNLAAIGYHYGSKDELRRVLAKSVAAYLRKVGPRSAASQMQGIDLEDMTSDQAQSMFRAMAKIAASPKPEGSLDEAVNLYFFQEFHSASDAAEILYDGVFKSDLEMVALIVSKIRGIDPDTEEAKVAALMLIAQISFIWGPFNTPVKRMGWNKVGQRECDLIINNIWLA